MKNSITDVPGIQVGHFTLSDGDIQTGVTAILPYPLSVRNRKLFIGSFASGNWNEWTGLHVAQDFGTFSSFEERRRVFARGVAPGIGAERGYRRTERTKRRSVAGEGIASYIFNVNGIFYSITDFLGKRLKA